MDFDFTSEQRLFISSFKKFVDESIVPHQPEDETKGMFPIENNKKLASIGYLGLQFEEKYGGSKADPISIACAQEILASKCPSTFLSVGASIGLFGMSMAVAGSEEQKQLYLPRLIQGETVGCFGLTEPQSGSDVKGTKTKAKQVQGGYILNGEKTLITNAPCADHAIIAAILEEDNKPGEALSLFVVDSQTQGFTQSKALKKMGLNGSPTGSLHLENCFIPENHLVGQKHHGFKQIVSVLEMGRIGITAMSIGIAQRAMDLSISYALERKAFGKSIAHFQDIHFKIADMKIQIEGARLQLLKCAWLKAQNKPVGEQASIAKYFASEMCLKIVNDAVQIFGGYGYLSEYEIERLYRDARLMTIGEGTSIIQQGIIIKNMLNI